MISKLNSSQFSSEIKVVLYKKKYNTAYTAMSGLGHINMNMLHSN